MPAGSGLWLARGCFLRITRPEPNAPVVYRPAGLVHENGEGLRELPYPSLSFPGFGFLVVLFASGGLCNLRGRKRKESTDFFFGATC